MERLDRRLRIWGIIYHPGRHTGKLTVGDINDVVMSIVAE
jgi:hypothetical protein